jgi:hypothetical protein
MIPSPFKSPAYENRRIEKLTCDASQKLAAEPMMPFFVAGLIVLYGVNAGANAMMDSEEFRNDPRTYK